MHELRSQGFVLPAAIFLLVVLGGLAGWMMQLTLATQAQDALAVEGERAYRAAEAGLEAGIYAARASGSCAAQTLNQFSGQLSRFTARVTCIDASIIESGSTSHLYQITSMACNQLAPDTGICFGDPSQVSEQRPTLPEYAEREMQATVESGS